MISDNNIAALIGAHVTDLDGNKIGTVGQIYVDPGTGRPNWATVKTGLFGTSQSFVPLEQAENVGGELRTPFTKDVVKDAPRVDSDAELTDAEEDELYAYYAGNEAGASFREGASSAGAGTAATAAHSDAGRQDLPGVGSDSVGGRYDSTSGIPEEGEGGRYDSTDEDARGDADYAARDQSGGSAHAGAERLRRDIGNDSAGEPDKEEGRYDSTETATSGTTRGDAGAGPAEGGRTRLRRYVVEETTVDRPATGDDDVTGGLSR